MEDHDSWNTTETTEESSAYYGSFKKNSSINSLLSQSNKNKTVVHTSGESFTTPTRLPHHIEIQQCNSKLGSVSHCSSYPDLLSLGNQTSHLALFAVRNACTVILIPLAHIIAVERLSVTSCGVGDSSGYLTVTHDRMPTVHIDLLVGNDF